MINLTTRPARRPQGNVLSAICFALAKQAIQILPLLFCATAKAVEIDGQINADEWAGAQVFSEFVALQPLTGKAIPAALRTEAKLLATAEGLAIAISALQPASIPRMNSRVQRDFSDAVDQINFMIDFDADGRAGYNFAVAASNDIADEVITRENQFSKDWDGDWQHAVVANEAGYQYELLIPWSITSMQPGANGKRTVAVYFDRVIANTGQRFGTPFVSYTQPRFLSDFQRVEITAFDQSALAITPYAVALTDLKRSEQSYKTGADIFWKPNSNHQFALTINPDFGQVESDELVVNFDNVETFFTDKRPFFTDNQAAFESTSQAGDLLYTRRIGGPADNGDGAAQIRAAAKASGNVGDFGYAVFGASEAESFGRDFSFLRASHRGDKHSIELTQTAVDRPFLDRAADVSAVQSVIRPNAQWSINASLHRSQIQQLAQRTEGYGGAIVADWDMPGPFRQQYFYTEVDAQDNLNDLGFQDRNNYRYFEWETGYRQDALDESSAFASHAWEAELVQQNNLDGYPLRRAVTLQRFSDLRDGSTQFFFVRQSMPGFDDRISRGNGIARIKGGLQGYFTQFRARQNNGKLSWNWFANVVPGRGTGQYNIAAGFDPRFFLSDQLDVQLGLAGIHWNDWLLWRGGNRLGSYSGTRLDFSTNLNWFISDSQELRIKLQAIAVDATARRAYQLGSDGTLLNTGNDLLPVNVRNLGFQIRYRYKLGPLSDLFAVYSRGGADSEAVDQNALQTLAEAFELRDDDQFLLKLAYRFDW
jgi:Domain of unknown function (DUF5916)